jgi:large subunit ribosomal protein L22
MKAFLKNYRHAPRKVRLIANHVRGKNVAEALTELEFMPHKGAKTMHKLISSAVANARQDASSVKEEDLTVKTVTVDKGVVYVRYMPRAFGRATPINRACSHVFVELALVQEPITPAPMKATKEKKEEPKEKQATTKAPASKKAPAKKAAKKAAANKK